MSLARLDRAYELTKELLSKSKFNPKAIKGTTPDKMSFPCVVMNLISESSRALTTGLECVIFNEGFEFDIYADTKKVGQKTYAGIKIANEIKDAIVAYFVKTKGMRLISATPAPNVRNTAYRIVVRVNGSDMIEL